MDSFIFLQLILISIFTLDLWLHFTSRGEVLAPLALRGWRGRSLHRTILGGLFIAFFWSFGHGKSFSVSLLPLTPPFVVETFIPLAAAGAALPIMIVFGTALLSPRRGDAS
jgi:hypothetical protein